MLILVIGIVQMIAIGVAICALNAAKNGPKIFKNVTEHE